MLRVACCVGMINARTVANVRDGDAGLMIGLKFSAGEDAEQEQDDANGDKDEEQSLRDARSSAGDAAETE